MTNHEKWNEFLSNLRATAQAAFENTQEYEYQKQHRQQIDELLDTNLTRDEKFFLDEILQELDAVNQREVAAMYRQGFKDCVWLLKDMGVIG